MKWIKERDLLIAQTMAFVQSVAGKKATAEAREVAREVRIEPTRVESAQHDEIAQVERLSETAPIKTPRIEAPKIEALKIEAVQITRPSPVRVSDVRQEIRGRVAAFRAHQELFHRERDEYYNSVVTRLRASSEHAPKVPGDLPKP
jgi:hypothetical protein